MRALQHPGRRLMLGLAARATAVLGAAALAGCANFRLATLLERLGLAGRTAPPALAPALQQRLDGLYARGARALLANDIEGAVAAWREYAALAPTTLARARQVRGHLTLLDREAASRFVQRAAAQEGARPFLRTDRLHIAVLPFGSLGPAAAGASRAGAAAFNRAVVAMIAVDLGRVPGLTVLEREKVELLTQELKLSASALVDPATAAAPGRMLGAGTLVAGSVYNAPGPAGPGSGRYRLNAAVSDVARGRLVGQNEAEGRQDEFFVLQKRLVHGILDLRAIRDRPAAVDTLHTRSWEAYARFATGLQLLAEDRFAEARTAFLAALQIDPGFVLAEEAFLGTPEAPTTLQQMQDSARAGLAAAPPAR